MSDVSESTSNVDSTRVETPPQKKRNPVERVIVWGVILILLALVGIEYSARRAHSTAVDTLMENLRISEQTGKDTTADDVKAAVGGKSPRVEDVSDKGLLNGARRVEIFSWFSLNPLNAREVYVYYGIGDAPVVVSVSTEEETETIAPPTELDAIQKEDLKVLREGLEKGLEDAKNDPSRTQQREVFQKALDGLNENESADDASPADDDAPKSPVKN